MVCHFFILLQLIKGKSENLNLNSVHKHINMIDAFVESTIRGWCPLVNYTKISLNNHVLSDLFSLKLFCSSFERLRVFSLLCVEK